MSAETVHTALATLELQITGVQAAYAQAPLSLANTELPAFVNFTGAAAEDFRFADEKGLVIETRVYRLRLYVAPVLAGTPGATDQAEPLCRPYFTRVRDFFNARPSLGRPAGVQRARIIGDGGVQVLPFSQESYVGIEFRLSVEEYAKITYAANE